MALCANKGFVETLKVFVDTLAAFVQKKNVLCRKSGLCLSGNNLYGVNSVL